jgi:acetolactate synthase-1/2/3 large subunit
LSETAASPHTRTLTGGQIVLQSLKRAGVRVVYGVPGGQTLSILDAIYDDPEVRFVAVRHEMAAAHAADAHFRVTGEPGVCLVTTGPGVTHAVSGIGGAFRDRSAIVVLTCNSSREYLEEEDAQAADHVALLRPLTKSSAFVADERALTRTIRVAFSTALEGRLGPAHVDIPRDILEGTFSEDLDRDDGARHPVRLPPMSPDPRAVEEAGRLLEGAERPVLWVGNGVALADASEAVLNLAERLKMPIITTFSGIGAVPSDHPLVFGPRSRHGTKLTHSLLEQADLLFALGMRLSSSSTHRWSAQLPPILIHNDVDASAIGRHYFPDVALPGDAKLVLEGLSVRLERFSAPPSREDWLTSLEQERENWRREVFDRPPEDERGKIHPIALMDELARLMPRDVILAVDAGNPGIWSHLLPINGPRSYMKPVNYGQMGFALPAAIAAKRARPERPVMALIGDGSLGMSVAELETAVREKLAVTIVVLNDSAYNNIRQEQLTMMGSPRYIGVDFQEVDYAKVAEGFGAWGRRAVGAEQLRSAMSEALLQADRPALVDVTIDEAPNVWKQPF